MYDYLFELLSGVIVNSSLAISGYRAIKRSSSFTRGFCAATLAYLTNSRISAASSGLLNVMALSPEILFIIWLNPEIPLYCPLMISRPVSTVSGSPRAKFFVTVQFIIRRVFDHPIGMDTGSMSKCVRTNSRLVNWNWNPECIAGKFGNHPCLR